LYLGIFLLVQHGRVEVVDQYEAREDRNLLRLPHLQEMVTMM
jgi:hypothetical protein